MRVQHRILLVTVASITAAFGQIEQPGTETSTEFAGRIEPASAILSKSWKVRISYGPYGRPEASSDIQEVMFGDDGSFQTEIAALPTAPNTTFELRFVLVDSDGKVVANLVPRETDTGYLSTFTGVLYPLHPDNPAISGHITVFGVAYVEDAPLKAQISIHATDPPFYLRSPVVVEFTMENAGAEVFMATLQSDDWDYTIALTDVSGRAVPLSDYGRRAASPEIIWRNILRAMHPGDKLKTSVDLSKLYIFSTPGTFRITVRRRVFRFGTAHPQDISSPEWRFDILPPI